VVFCALSRSFQKYLLFKKRRQIVFTGEENIDEVEVFYIDFGNKEFKHPSSLQPLPEQFAKLPAQAIPCALNEVC